MKVVSVASWGDGQLRLKYFRKLLHALQGELRLEASRGLTRLSKAKLCFSLLMVSLVGCNVPDTRFEGLTLSPDGTYILAVYSHSATSSFIYRIPVDTGVAKRVTNVSGGFEGIPSFSPDGKRIAFSFAEKDEAHSRIILANADGSDPQPLTTTSGADDFFPLFSTDKKTIIFARSNPTGHEWNFFASDLNGTNVRQLTNENAYQVSRASVSPDGKRMMFVNKDIQHNDVIAVYSLEEPPKLERTLKPHVAGEPGQSILDDASFLADGKSVLFLAASVKGGPYDYDVYRTDVQTQAIERLTKDNGYAYSLQPSQDGKKAVFVRGALSGSGKKSQLSLIDLATGKVSPLSVTGLE